MLIFMHQSNLINVAMSVGYDLLYAVETDQCGPALQRSKAKKRRNVFFFNHTSKIRVHKEIVVRYLHHFKCHLKCQCLFELLFMFSNASFDIFVCVLLYFMLSCFLYLL